MLRILLLGGARIEREGVPARGRATQKRRLAILALLAVAPARTLSRDRIVGLLWPDAEPDAARKVLSEALYVMRRELGDNLLITAGDTVALGQVTTDVGDFLASIELGSADADRAAIAAWQGPFLDGWYLDDAPDFERWAEDQRSRLARTYAEAVERVIRAVETDAPVNGSAPSAELPALWQRLVDLDPLRSRYALGLATARAAAGERAAALQALSAHGDRVRAELEVEPDAQIVALEAQLRAGAMAGSGARRSDTASAPPTELPSAVVAPTLPTRDSALPQASSIAAPLPQRRGMFVALATLGVIALAMAAIAVWQRPTRATPALDPRRLAVLYFNDGSLERDLGPVADNITEAVVSQLSGVNALTVISTNGVKPLRGRAVPIDSVAARLNVGSIIEGTVQRSGERLAVTVRLIDANTGAYQATMNFERSTADLLALERDIAREAADAIRTRLGQDVRLRELRAGTSNVRALQLLARGNRDLDDAKALTDRQGGADGNAARLLLRHADSLFVQAIAEDPRWVEPWVQRGWTAMARSLLVKSDERTAVSAQAVAIADSALQRFGEQAALLELRGLARYETARVRGGGGEAGTQLSEGAQDLEAAVALDSMRARAWGGLSLAYWMGDAPQRAVQVGERALALDTYMAEAHNIMLMLVFASIVQNDLQNASRWCREGRIRYPTDHQFALCELTILAYDTDRRPDPARAWKLVAQIDSIDPPYAAQGTYRTFAPIYRRLSAATVSARAGDAARARATLDEIYRSIGNDTDLRFDVMQTEIPLRVALGDRQVAESLLAVVLKARPIDRKIFEKDPRLKSLRIPPLADVK